MKTTDTENRPLAECRPNENGEEIIYLTCGGRTRYVVVPLDEGDEEALAVRKNDRLMAYITEAVARARSGPTKSLAEIKKQLGIEG